MARKIKIEVDPSMVFLMQFTEQELELLHMFCDKMVTYIMEKLENTEKDPKKVPLGPEFEAKVEKLIKDADQNRTPGHIQKKPGSKQKRITRVRVEDPAPPDHFIFTDECPYNKEK